MKKTSERKSYHLVPAKGTDRGKQRGWLLKLRGRVVRYLPIKKREAVAFARVMAMANRPSQLVIHSINGRIENEWTYGDDPSRYRG
ncbi:MAG: DUF2188 domain-containing protein [Acidobacteriota bacterium]